MQNSRCYWYVAWLLTSLRDNYETITVSRDDVTCLAVKLPSSFKSVLRTVSYIKQLWLNTLHLICCTFHIHCYTATPPACDTVTSFEFVSTTGEFWFCWVSSLRLNMTPTTTNAIKSNTQIPAIPITSGFTKFVSRAPFCSAFSISFDPFDDAFRRVSAGSDSRRIILIFVPWPWTPIWCVSSKSRRDNLWESSNRRLSTSDKTWEVISFWSAVEPRTERAGLGRLSEVTE